MATQAAVAPLGFTVAVPVTWKVWKPTVGGRVETLVAQAVISALSWQVTAPVDPWMYSANWQSPVLPEVTPPPKAHHPQNPKPEPLPGKTPVPAKPICQFSAP